MALDVEIDVRICITPIADSGNYQVCAEVTRAQDIDENIFIFQRKPETGGTFVDEFWDVATPSQMMEYPAGEPDCSSSLFFRDDKVCKEFEIAGDAISFKEEISKKVQFLACEWEEIGEMLNTCEDQTFEATEEDCC